MTKQKKKKKTTGVHLSGNELGSVLSVDHFSWNEDVVSGEIFEELSRNESLDTVNFHYLARNEFRAVLEALHPGVDVMKLFFPPSLTTRPNKLERLSLETLSCRVLEFASKVQML
jgi:hypothetical protein